MEKITAGGMAVSGGPFGRGTTPRQSSRAAEPPRPEAGVSAHSGSAVVSLIRSRPVNLQIAAANVCVEVGVLGPPA